jgi:pyrroline-5-carboxylate reductase
MSIDCRIAMIGAGNLGSAFMAGILRARAIAPEQLLATTGTPERAQKLSQDLPVKVAAGNNAGAAAWADVVIVAVKPGKVREILEEMRGSLRPEQILVSLAAGVPIALLESWLPRPIPVLRASPSLAMRVCQSASAISVGRHATPRQREIVEEIFQAVGTTVVVEDEAIHGATALAGSGPGFIYWLMEVFALGGIEAGLPPEAASTITRQTFLGASELIAETGLDPALLRAQVTTPKGTTAAGIAALENHGAKEALVAAIVAAAERSRELSRSLADLSSAPG